MYLYSIPETTLIIYGISIERCVLYKCNADRWLCTCFWNGVGVGDLLLRYDFFFIFNLNQFETMSMCTGRTDWKMQIPSALNQYFFLIPVRSIWYVFRWPEDFKSLLKVNWYQYASNNVRLPKNRRSWPTEMQ
jgi:hypothetical protein